MAPTRAKIASMTPETKVILAAAKWKTIGDNIFGYAAYCRAASKKSLYVMSFYGGVSVISIFRINLVRTVQGT